MKLQKHLPKMLPSNHQLNMANNRSFCSMDKRRSVK